MKRQKCHIVARITDSKYVMMWKIVFALLNAFIVTSVAIELNSTLSLENKILIGEELRGSNIGHISNLDAIADLIDKDKKPFCTAILITETELYSTKICIGKCKDNYQEVSVIIKKKPYKIKGLKFAKLEQQNVGLITLNEKAFKPDIMRPKPENLCIGKEDILTVVGWNWKRVQYAMVNFKFISKGLKCIGQDVENPEFDKIMFCGFPTGEKIKFEDADDGSPVFHNGILVGVLYEKYMKNHHWSVVVAVITPDIKFFSITNEEETEE